MKRSEREFMEKFNDSNLNIDSRFRRGLKEKMMKNLNQPVKRANRKPFVLAGALAATTAVIILAAQFMPATQDGGTNNSDGNKITVPFSPKTASAAQLARRSEDTHQKIKNGEVPFMIRTERLEAGPMFAACDTGAMGGEVGRTVEYHAFMSKDSGAEALYAVARGVNPADHSYYNANDSQLSAILDYIAGSVFTMEGYNQVNAKGEPFSGEVKSEQQNGREIYRLYGVSKFGGDTCEGQTVVYEFLVDAEDYTYISAAKYKGEASEANRISTFVSDLELRQLSEADALKAMEKAGFDRENASSTLPERLLQ